MQLNTYLTFGGDCKEAFEYYAKVLNGKIVAMFPHRGTPAEKMAPPEWLDKIMHARLEVEGQALMGSDRPPQYNTKPAGFSVNISVKDVAEAERIFAALAQGGDVKMPIAETFWAQRFGMLIDRYGTPWMVNCEKPMQA